MFKGFRDFLLRGNVIDLAVAVVMGTAFTAVVTSFSSGLINPLLAVFGGTDELGLGFRLVSSKPATFVAIGPIISAFLNFAIVAAVLYFVLIMPMRHLTNRFGTKKAAEPTETELLIEIRDLLAQRDAEVARHEADHRRVEAEVEADAAVDRGAGQDSPRR
ncbi:large conductance mechanosensitive channel protein MscL [Nocardia jiangsuensis]|uniref:Large-conductance mechanosensitive channel n=1 Tax=Nocardia jiangsuensis TaxID=1691563 RepID=A0ABV8DT87_9NOCA